MTTLVAAQAGYDFDGWRAEARRLLLAGIHPADATWGDGQEVDLFATTASPRHGAAAQSITVSNAFIALARKAILHRDPARHALLYKLLWRLQRERGLMRDSADPDVQHLHRLERQVRRDLHKMRAFLRFSPVRDEDGGQRYIAWFEPEHHIVEVNAAFFTSRFHTMRWSILTPDVSLHWDGETLLTAQGSARPRADVDDPFEQLWLRYYGSIFNPARLKVAAMKKEMPQKYWRNMPEAALIPDLVAGARQRELAMIERAGTSSQMAQVSNLAGLAEAIEACRACPIGCNGTRAVAGEGPSDAALMIVGEQPGDIEEDHGRPFVGPAGQLLDAMLARSGISRPAAYVTNAVKHFKYQPSGKRRLHQTPTAGEIDHCRWWLDRERRLVRPATILALGASAGRAILGRTPSINSERGKPATLADGTELWVTVHPSYLLRIPAEKRAAEEARFLADLQALAASLQAVPGLKEGGSLAGKDSSAISSS